MLPNSDRWQVDWVITLPFTQGLPHIIRKVKMNPHFKKWALLLNAKLPVIKESKQGEIGRGKPSRAKELNLS